MEEDTVLMFSSRENLAEFSHCLGRGGGRRPKCGEPRELVCRSEFIIEHSGNCHLEVLVGIIIGANQRPLTQSMMFTQSGSCPHQDPGSLKRYFKKKMYHQYCSLGLIGQGYVVQWSRSWVSPKIYLGMICNGNFESPTWLSQAIRGGGCWKISEIDTEHCHTCAAFVTFLCWAFDL